MTTDLTERTTITELVHIFERAEADIRASFAKINSALTAIGFAFENDGDQARIRYPHVRWRHETNYNEPDEAMHELRRSCWGCLVERLKVRRIMSIKAWDELQRTIEKEDPPPITVENVEALVRRFQVEAGDMLRASIEEVFDWLRPRCSEYKTNTEFEIGKRVVLSWMVEPWVTRWTVVHSHEQNLIALERVFAMCDGQAFQPDEGISFSAISSAIKSCKLPGPCQGETPYFKFRGYRNRNLHLEFKRPDLVTKLNAIAGGARLKPVRAAG